MITAILRDASHWKPESGRPDNGNSAVLRLYSDKAIAGYVLSGVPEFVSLNLYAVWKNPANLTGSVVH